MTLLSKYEINFSGLIEGIHLFDFSADKRFFEEFEESEIEEGNVNIQVELEKRSAYLRLNFIISGDVELVCDRCLGKFMQTVKSRTPVMVKFSDNETEDTDEVIYLHQGDYKISIGRLIYEFIVLSIPIRRVHPDDEFGNSFCDQEMIKKIEEYKVTDSHKSSEYIDPRWNELKKIIGN